MIHKFKVAQNGPRPSGWNYHCFVQGDGAETLARVTPISPALFEAFAAIARTYVRNTGYLARCFDRPRKVTLEFCTEEQAVFSMVVLAPVRTVPALAALLCESPYPYRVRIAADDRELFDFPLVATEYSPASRWYGGEAAYPFVPARIEAAVADHWARPSVRTEREAFVDHMEREISRSGGAL